jgi:hypothetical protein
MTDKKLGGNQRFREIWERSASGVLIPVGHISDASDRSSTNFLLVKERAQAIEQMYKDAGLQLARNSGLARFIANAKLLSDRWLSNDMNEATYEHMFALMHMQRIAQALLPLRGHASEVRYLKRLMSGEIDFFVRIASEAKDVLWELELWVRLQQRHKNVTLVDPPDIVVKLTAGELGVACKKIYSEKNVSKVLSEAARQVKGYDVGVVAINVDDLIPPQRILAVRDEQQMVTMLHDINAAFLQRNERHFRRYLGTERLVAALVSVNAIVDVRTWDPRFNNSQQSLVWMLPQLSEEKTKLMSQFHGILRQTPGD